MAYRTMVEIDAAIDHCRTQIEDLDMFDITGMDYRLLLRALEKAKVAATGYYAFLDLVQRDVLVLKKESYEFDRAIMANGTVVPWTPDLNDMDVAYELYPGEQITDNILQEAFGSTYRESYEIRPEV